MVTKLIQTCTTVQQSLYQKLTTLASGPEFRLPKRFTRRGRHRDIAAVGRERLWGSTAIRCELKRGGISPWVCEARNIFGGWELLCGVEGRRRKGGLAGSCGSTDKRRGEGGSWLGWWSRNRKARVEVAFATPRSSWQNVILYPCAEWL